LEDNRHQSGDAEPSQPFAVFFDPKPDRENDGEKPDRRGEQPMGVLYVASYDSAAFTEEDQRVLRVMARIIADLLRIYTARQRITTGLADLIKDPITVDPSFKEFLSENDFMQDLEAMLNTIKEQLVADRDSQVQLSPDAYEPREISFIAIEIDDQERIANSYGDQTLRNLSRTVGQRIRDLLPALFTNYTDCKLYYIYGCRFYLFLRNFSLEKTADNAERLRKTLEGKILVKQSDLPSSTLALSKVSAHLGVTWYLYEKLKEFFAEGQDRSIADISSTFYHSLDFILKLGASEGGNNVFAWDPETKTYVAYQPGEDRR